MEYSKTLITTSLVILFLSGVSLAAVDPYQFGEYTANGMTIFRTQAIQLEYNLRIYAPQEAGTFKVIYFISGFDSRTPGITYHTMMMHIASHGYVVITPEKLQDSLIALNATWIDEVEDWAQKHLSDRLTSAGFDENLVMDFENEYFIGHSSGSHVVVNYLIEKCGNFKGLVLMSPVDGVDPFGITNEFCITPGELVNFDIPTLILPTGLDAVSGRPEIGVWPPCAPEDLSNNRFYDAMPGATWSVNASDYGHGDMLEPEPLEALRASGICASNLEVELEDDTFRTAIAGEIVAYLRGIDKGECEMFNYLEDPSTGYVSLDMKNKNLNTLSYCGNGYCNWKPVIH